MKKVLATLLPLVLVSCILNARPRFSYGLEWGYTGTFLKTWQYNYIYSSGSRIVDNGNTPRYFSNGSILANAGLDLGDRVNLSVYSGLLGVYSRRWMIPVELRARWCPGGLRESGPVVHLGGAAAFPTATLYETAARVNVGGGYRVKVYGSTSVDFLVSFQLCTDHESITDPDTGLYVPVKDITLNLVEYWGLNFSLALNF